MSRHIHFILYLYVLLCLTACRHEEISSESQSEHLLTVVEARSWFEKNWGSSLVRKKVNGVSGSTLSLTTLFNWNDALSENDSTWAVVSVPWEYESVGEMFSLEETYEELEPEYLSDNCQFQRLVILQHRKEQTLYAVKMVIIPSLTYIAKNISMLNSNTYLQLDSALDGVILFYTINGLFVNGWGVQDGIIISAIEPIERKKTDSINKKNISSFHTVCYDIVTCYYYYGVCGDYVSEPRFNGCQVTDHTCRLVEFQSNDKLVNISHYNDLMHRFQDNGGGGGGFEPPILPPADPCEYLAKLQEEVSVTSLINDYTERSKNACTEEGCMICENGTIIYPIKKTLNRLTYDITSLNAQTRNSKIQTAIHFHPEMGSSNVIPSVADLKQIYNLYQRENITDVSKFGFIIVSPHGTIIIRIADEEKFVSNFDEMLNTYMALFNENHRYCSFEEARKVFLTTILNADSGLVILFGAETEINTNIINDWTIIQPNGELKNPCL